MQITQKKYHFVSNTEGWVAHTINHNHLVWQMPYKSRPRRPKPPVGKLGVIGGTLRMSTINCTNDDPQVHPSGGENYWLLTTTWSALGVTESPIIKVTADYYARFSTQFTLAYSLLSSKPPDNFSMSDDEFGIGGFEILNASDVLIGEISSRHLAPEYNNGWYDNALAETVYQYPNNGQVGALIDDIPPTSWLHITGSDVNIPEANSHSTDMVKFKIFCLLPNLSSAGVFRSVRVKIDRVLITITSGSESTPVINNALFFGGD
jgi:hypothetical protein